MYLLAIGWMYVVAMMAAAEIASPAGSWLGAVVTLLLYGLLPVSVLLYILGAPMRGAGAARARTGARRRAGRISAGSRSQMPAAIRPVTPSRRYEKNRDRSSKVQSATEWIRLTPAASKPIVRQAGQVGQPFAGRAGAGDEAAPGAGARTLCGSAPKASTTSAPTSNWRGPMQAPSQASTASGRAVGGLAQRGERCLDHPGREPAPTGVRRADRPTAGAQQHRQAVGDLDQAGDAGLGGDARVGLVNRRVGRGIRGAQAHHPAAVHLLQPDRPGAVEVLLAASAGCARPPPESSPMSRFRFNRSNGGCADAARAGRHQRTDAGDRPRRPQPVGRPPIAARAQRPRRAEPVPMAVHLLLTPALLPLLEVAHLAALVVAGRIGPGPPDHRAGERRQHRPPRPDGPPDRIRTTSWPAAADRSATRYMSIPRTGREAERRRWSTPTG